MAPRQSALRSRSHNARTHHSRYRWATPHPEHSVICAAALDQIEQIFTDVLLIPACYCNACGRIIDKGHTCFHIVTNAHARYLVCWECGEAIMQHCGWATPAEFPTCPPHGGGSKPSRTPTPNQCPTPRPDPDTHHTTENSRDVNP